MNLGTINGIDLDKWVWLVKHRAKRYHHKWRYQIDLDDIEQMGMIGLVLAARKFDHSRGYKFNTYAHQYVDGHMKDGMRTCATVPPKVQAYWAAKGVRLPHYIPMSSLADGDNPNPLASRTAPEVDLAEDFDRAEMAKGLRHLVTNSLPERYARVLRMRFGFDDREPMTLEEIGAALGVTRERVRQIQDSALERLRHAMPAAQRKARERQCVDAA